MSKKSYKQNKLETVIARIDFMNKLPYLNETLPAESMDYLKEHFPISEPAKTVNQHVQLIPNEPPRIITDEVQQWNFHGKSREKTLQINPNYMLITYNRYINYKVFKEDFVEVVNKLFLNNPKEYISRIGLRFINVFDNFSFSDNNIDDYINSKYLTQQMIDRSDKTCSRYFNVLEYTTDLEKSKIQYGFFNPDYPSPLRNLNFVIDIDVFFDHIIEANEIETIFDKLHDHAEDVYENFITEKTRGLLNE